MNWRASARINCPARKATPIAGALVLTETSAGNTARLQATARELLGKIVADNGVDRIAHFAFILRSPKPGQMLPYVQVQCLGTANVFEAARVAGVRRVLFASSVAAYGRQDVSLLSEELVVNP